MTSLSRREIQELMRLLRSYGWSAEEDGLIYAPRKTMQLKITDPWNPGDLDDFLDRMSGRLERMVGRVDRILPEHLAGLQDAIHDTGLLVRALSEMVEARDASG